MRTNNNDIADFYRQIALLLKSGLPLPDSIYQLGINFNKPDFKAVLLELSEDTSKGETLASTMKKHPDYFTEFHIRMIEAAEKSEMLPETLSEIARTSHLNLQLTSMVREIAISPVFTLWFAFIIINTLLAIITPQFKVIFQEMLGGEPLPLLTELILSIGEIFVQYQPFFIGGCILYPIFFIWLFGGGIFAKRLFIKIVSFFPGAGNIFYNLDMARLCAMWSVLMKQNISAVEALDTTKSLIESRRISSALQRISESADKGVPLVEAIEDEKVISSMIPLTVKHVPEKELPDELANLAILFREKASTATRNAGAVWEITLLILLASTVGTIVISMFMPLISIIKKLGGG
jgi:type IV pilus assembly protein PilC